MGIGVFSSEKAPYDLHTVFIPSSGGIFVHMPVTSKETRNVSSERFLLSIKCKKSVGRLFLGYRMK